MVLAAAVAARAASILFGLFVLYLWWKDNNRSQCRPTDGLQLNISARKQQQWRCHSYNSNEQISSHLSVGNGFFPARVFLSLFVITRCEPCWNNKRKERYFSCFSGIRINTLCNLSDSVIIYFSFSFSLTLRLSDSALRRITNVNFAIN